MPDQHNPAATASLESAAEKREATRYKVLRQGKILLEGRTIYCAVHDLSTTGARLQVGDVELPDWFELIVMGEPQPLYAEVNGHTANLWA